MRENGSGTIVTNPSNPVQDDAIHSALEATRDEAVDMVVEAVENSNSHAIEYRSLVQAQSCAGDADNELLETAISSILPQKVEMADKAYVVAKILCDIVDNTGGGF